MIEWKEFGHEAISGDYWIAGKRPDYDVDAGDDGRPVLGEYLGEANFVSLVYIQFKPEPDGFLFAEAIDEPVLGRFELDYHITHYAPFSPPEPPESPQQTST